MPTVHLWCRNETRLRLEYRYAPYHRSLSGLDSDRLKRSFRPTITTTQPGLVLTEATSTTFSIHEGAGRRHGPKPTSGSFWTIADVTAPGTPSYPPALPHPAPVDVGVVLGDLSILLSSINTSGCSTSLAANSPLLLPSTPLNY